MTSIALFYKIKPNVNDFNSITALHFINGGKEALHKWCDWKCCQCLLFWNKYCPCKHSLYRSRKRRTTSIWPPIAKSLDLYIRDLSTPEWEASQAETQFQGTGMSHEMAALLLAESITNSTVNQKKPIFTLYLGAKSLKLHRVTHPSAHI